MDSRLGSARGLLALFFVFFFSFAGVAGAETQLDLRNFNHASTGFPLTGGHVSADCGTCHVGGMFKGTPRNCAGCHAKGARVVATAMSPSHIVTNDPCESCHTNTATFLGARFNHVNAYPGSCTTCHNGRIATGKPTNHNHGLRMTDSCDRCHKTVTWVFTGFNHVGILPGSCATQCHNGTLATGRPGSHTTALKSTASCDACHRTIAWYPTFYNHTSVVPGSCPTCHNGSTAAGKPSNHGGLRGTWSCDQCHNTVNWLPARYNHVAATPGSCATCHDGISAAAKPAGHSGAKALMACDSCHNTTAWLPAVYRHSGVMPGGCLSCHAAQRPTGHTARGYVASCDACHTIGSNWVFNHALQQGKHTCNSCHSKHHNSTPCDYCHTVNGWGG